ncbi:MAG: hypothetical protein COB67_00470 [SAR324 cluster bacterium]|uniref:Uncharacterized protein n=1 Tax=SAR324 cluster bacterium TaxID=2024889 RepID=A0A2A4TBQ1_9DELT|nr:MAG: hypothetical protein COB67_00470 [SAR324 cluster bacterium]
MTKAQQLIEDILQIAHQDNDVSIFEIQDALRVVIEDVDVMVEECKVKENKNISTMRQRQPIVDISKINKNNLKLNG